ncbi:MAG: hypothetical protein R2712_22450 [Vicinamibacterales bacterium]
MARAWGTAAAALLLAAVIGHAGMRAQTLSYLRGQNISPAFEGWEQNDDGSFNMLFGYMNRNWEEELDIPVGPGNAISPGPPDQGQPTHFYPRRNRFVFKVRVPRDWGDKELVWTLTANGRTERAYATLRPDSFVDDLVQASEQGALGAGVSSPAMRKNTAPTLKVDSSPTRSVKVGQPISLTAYVLDDGVPRPRFGPGSRSARFFDRPVNGQHPSQRAPVALTVGSQAGLRMSWYVYRGPNQVEFSPEQTKVWEDTRAGANSPWAPRWIAPIIPDDGRIDTTVTFRAPGTYVLRCMASDGAIHSTYDVTFTVSR